MSFLIQFWNRVEELIEDLEIDCGVFMVGPIIFKIWNIISALHKLNIG